ncbi:polysaccharide deacetylase family protein [Streptomyces prunicolor]
MLFSGIAWSGTGYEVTVVGDDGRQTEASLRFEPGRTDEMISYLRSSTEPLVTVIESTNGILDGRMMAAGLDVYRADPGLLPERPLFGSVSATDLARIAQQDLSALARLVRTRGTQTGRESDLAAGMVASTAQVTALSATGRWLEHGERDRPQIAITFDDGPLPPYTGQILDILERYGVPATFFCVGMNASAHTDELVRMREQGHGIGNHTWSHPFLPELSQPQLVEQIERAGEAIAKASGTAPPTLFRPPYGSRTPEVVGWLTECVPKVALWDVEPDDWSMPGTEIIVRDVLDQARQGSIILLHDGGGDRSQTVAALPPIIEGLLARDYRFVTLDELTAAPV